MAIAMATNPTDSETFPAWIIRTSMSRPIWSVPSGCLNEGPRFLAFSAESTTFSASS